MKTNFKHFFGLLTIALLILSCEPEEVVTQVVVETVAGAEQTIADLPYAKSGFVASSILSTPTSFSYFTNYSSDLPSGAIDLTTNTSSSFSRYFPNTIYKFLAFGPSLDTENLELNRYAVDEETNKIVRAGAIPLSANLSQVLILNDDLGVYTIFDTQSLFLFNPTTMQFIQEIQMPEAMAPKDLGESQANSYFHIIHRPQDNRVFLPLTTNTPVTPQFYEGTDIFVEVVNLNTRSWEKTAVFNGATYPLTRGMENPLVDEQGNIFLLTQGQYSLDFQFGPTAPPSSRPQFLKIPSGGTDFDPDYAFNPVDALGFQNSVAQLCTGSIYDANGIAYAAMTAEADVPRVNELLGLLATGMITDAQFNELVGLVTNSPNMKWTRIDLNAQTAETIADITSTAGFVYPFSYKANGKFYFQVFNPTESINGYYEFDPTTNTSTNIYNISTGGVATQLFILQE
ncbi:hypothetical protein [Flagellimonas eckloniae]|nr:hypothetical protein [Allomuricauda eckloniae]